MYACILYAHSAKILMWSISNLSHWQDVSSLTFSRDLFVLYVRAFHKIWKCESFEGTADDATETALLHQKDQIWSLSAASCLSVSHRGHPEWAHFSFISTLFLSICCLFAWLTLYTAPPIVQSCHLQLGNAKPDFALSATCADA